MSLKHHREAIIAMLTIAVDQCIQAEERTIERIPLNRIVQGKLPEAALFDTNIKIRYKGEEWSGFEIVSRPVLDLTTNPITSLARVTKIKRNRTR